MSIFDKFKKSNEDQKDVAAEPAAASVQADKKPAPEAATEAPAIKKTAPSTVGPKSVKPSYGVLVRPLITEKATNLGQHNQYVFEVSNRANKIQVAQAIEARYGVKPLRVNILNNSGKTVRRGRQVGRTKDWKKAIVALPEGRNIQIHEGV